MIPTYARDFIVLVFCLGMALTQIPNEDFRREMDKATEDMNFLLKLSMIVVVEIASLGQAVGGYLIPFHVLVSFLILTFSVFGQYVFYGLGLLYVLMEKRRRQ